jgi:cell division GTPase FtsZ
MSDFNPIYNVGSQEKSNDTFDFAMPDIPDPIEDVKPKLQDRDAVGFKFGFIGAGQGGGKLAETFSQIGYARVGVINTADQDLATINVKNKLKFGQQQGAGKNREIAKQAFLNQKEDVVDFIKESIDTDIDRIFVTIGAGGGTGAGVCSELVKTVSEYQKTHKSSSPYVGLILALPKLSEGKKVSQNAYDTLKEACALVDQKIVSPLIILDNEKINSLYPKLSVNKFWQVANANICSLFHLFNNIITKNSQYSTFDTNDFRTVLDSGIMVFGATNILNFTSESEISKAVRENLKRNVLCGELDLSTGTVAAAVAIGDENTLDNIPQEYLDGAFNQLNRTLKTNSTIHQGIYKGVKEGLSIFTAIGGISTPEGKLEALLKSAQQV